MPVADPSGKRESGGPERTERPLVSMTNWMTGVCETNDIRIHYQRTGGSKPPLLLLHGLTGSGACWIPLARVLRRDYDVVMPDARGHGNSSTPSDGYRYEDHAGDVVDQQRRLLGSDEEEVLAQARVRHAHRRSEFVELIVAARLKTRMGAFDVLRPPNPEFRQVVAAICVPVLLVIGDHGVVSIETARELQGLNARLRVEQIQDAGHGVPYDQPERFEAVVRSFLQSVIASPAPGSRGVR